MCERAATLFFWGPFDDDTIKPHTLPPEPATWRDWWVGPIRCHAMSNVITNAEGYLLGHEKGREGVCIVKRRWYDVIGYNSCEFILAGAAAITTAKAAAGA